MKQARNAYEVVTNFSNNAYDHDKSHSFCCGVLESVLISALEQLPKGKREALMGRLDAITEKFYSGEKK